MLDLLIFHVYNNPISQRHAVYLKIWDQQQVLDHSSAQPATGNGQTTARDAAAKLAQSIA